MRLTAHFAILCSVALPVCAADFQTGQAAVAVIGQPSFSARNSDLNPIALSTSNGRLYVADASHHLLAFDSNQLSTLGSSPIAVLNQSVIAGISAVSVYGKSVAVADTTGRRVLLWRDASTESALKGPDIILSDPSALAEPISVALDGQRLYVGDAASHHVLVWNRLPQSNNQSADVVLGQSSDLPTANSIALPVALESDGQRLFVADSVFHRILVFAAADVPLDSNAVTNSASFQPGPLAPGALVTIAASGLSIPTADAQSEDAPLPHQLGGVEVLVDGTSLPLLSVSSSEIRAQLPYDIGDRNSVSLYVRSEQATTTAVALTLLPSSPALFAFPGKEPRPGIAVDNGAPVTATTPVKPGDVVTLWANGLALVNSGEDELEVQAGVPNAQGDAAVQMPVAATVNGSPAEVLSATLPHGSIGVYEIKVVVPAGLGATSSATLTISQEGRQSNSVTIPVVK